jgi:hypothetical protein
VTRFAYFRDPLCLAACILYALNRFWFRQQFGGEFLHGYFNDVLLIPAALPLVLWLQRRLGARTHDYRPQWSEIALHVTVWSFVAEAVAPQLLPNATGDWRDVVAYTAGAIASGCWWQALI